MDSIPKIEQTIIEASQAAVCVCFATPFTTPLNATAIVTRVVYGPLTWALPCAPQTVPDAIIPCSNAFEVFTIAAFSIEFAIRLFAIPQGGESRLGYLCSFYAWVRRDACINTRLIRGRCCIHTWHMVY
jgi:hypothetical protein